MVAPALPQGIMGEGPTRLFSERDGCWLRIWSECTNDQGFVRLARVRERGFDLSNEEELDYLAGIYAEWLLDDIYIVLKRTEVPNRVLCYPAEGCSEYHICKARKRGNDVDARRTESQARILREVLAPYCLPKSVLCELDGDIYSQQEYDDIMRRARRASRTQTRLIYATLTFDHQFFESPADAWAQVGAQWNRFISALRKRCGTTTVVVSKTGRLRSKRKDCKIHYVRSWEAHRDGWPHVHAVLAFEDWDWGIFEDANGVKRVKHVEIIKDAWKAGFADVRALTLETLKSGLDNVLWYVAKSRSDMDYRLVTQWPVKRLRTQSILWYLGKRAWAISRALLSQSDTVPGHDLISASSLTQTTLTGETVPEVFVEWEFVGLVRRADTDLDSDVQYLILKEPPPWLDKCWKPWAARGGLGWTSTWGD